MAQNKPARFDETDAAELIAHWHRLADLYEQDGRYDDAQRILRLAAQLEQIAANGITTSQKVVDLRRPSQMVQSRFGKTIKF